MAGLPGWRGWASPKGPGFRRMEYFLQQLINGVTLGAIYGLIAIGYTMVYGIIGMINFAHGEIYMIGAFVSVISFLVLGAAGITWVPFAVAVVLAGFFLSSGSGLLERLSGHSLGSSSGPSASNANYCGFMG